MRVDSEKAEQLSELLALHADGIAASIDGAPKWRKAWPASAAAQLFQKYYEVHPPSQTRPPRFGT
jgi:hypothetical protein